MLICVLLLKSDYSCEAYTKFYGTIWLLKVLLVSLFSMDNQKMFKIRNS